MITDFDENSVTFEYHDRRDKNRKKELTLEKEEFIRYFLDHVLPYCFTKIRHDGFLSNLLRHSKTASIRQMIEKYTSRLIIYCKFTAIRK